MELQRAMGEPRDSPHKEQKDWNEARPSQGAHPLGPLRSLLWHAFLLHLERYTKDGKCSQKAQKLVRALAEDEGKSVIRFNPLGKRGRPPPRGDVVLGTSL